MRRRKRVNISLQFNTAWEIWDIWTFGASIVPPSVKKVAGVWSLLMAILFIPTCTVAVFILTLTQSILLFLYSKLLFYSWALPNLFLYFLKHGRCQWLTKSLLHLVPGRATAPLLHEDPVCPCVSTVSQHIAKYPLAIPHLSADLLPPLTHTPTCTSPFQARSQYGHTKYTEHSVI